jgi:voltage-gated potassium channel
MLSALLMLRRVGRALRYAVREEDFRPVFGAGVLLVFIGTISYSLGEGWNIVDAFYFAVSTLTTTSVADPDLVLDERWMKVFTVFYLLIGIGVLVEILRRLGFAFTAVRAEEKAAKAAGKGGPSDAGPAT